MKRKTQVGITREKKPIDYIGQFVIMSHNIKEEDLSTIAFNLLDAQRQPLPIDTVAKCYQTCEFIWQETPEKTPFPFRISLQWKTMKNVKYLHLQRRDISEAKLENWPVIFRQGIPSEKDGQPPSPAPEKYILKDIIVFAPPRNRVRPLQQNLLECHLYFVGPNENTWIIGFYLESRELSSSEMTAPSTLFWDQIAGQLPNNDNVEVSFSMDDMAEPGGPFAGAYKPEKGWLWSETFLPRETDYDQDVISSYFTLLPPPTNQKTNIINQLFFQKSIPVSNRNFSAKFLQSCWKSVEDYRKKFDEIALAPVMEDPAEKLGRTQYHPSDSQNKGIFITTTTPETESEPETPAETEPEPEPETPAETEPEPDPETPAETEPEPEPEKLAEPETKEELKVGDGEWPQKRSYYLGLFSCYMFHILTIMTTKGYMIYTITASGQNGEIGPWAKLYFGFISLLPVLALLVLGIFLFRNYQNQEIREGIVWTMWGIQAIFGLLDLIILMTVGGDTEGGFTTNTSSVFGSLPKKFQNLYLFLGMANIFCTFVLSYLLTRGRPPLPDKKETEETGVCPPDQKKDIFSYIFIYIVVGLAVIGTITLVIMGLRGNQTSEDLQTTFLTIFLADVAIAVLTAIWSGFTNTFSFMWFLVILGGFLAVLLPSLPFFKSQDVAESRQNFMGIGLLVLFTLVLLVVMGTLTKMGKEGVQQAYAAILAGVVICLFMLVLQFSQSRIWVVFLLAGAVFSLLFWILKSGQSEGEACKPTVKAPKFPLSLNDLVGGINNVKKTTFYALLIGTVLLAVIFSLTISMASPERRLTYVFAFIMLELAMVTALAFLFKDLYPTEESIKKEYGIGESFIGNKIIENFDETFIPATTTEKVFFYGLVGISVLATGWISYMAMKSELPLEKQYIGGYVGVQAILIFLMLLSSPNQFRTLVSKFAEDTVEEKGWGEKLLTYTMWIIETVGILYFGYANLMKGGFGDQQGKMTAGFLTIEIAIIIVLIIMNRKQYLEDKSLFTLTIITYLGTMLMTPLRTISKPINNVLFSLWVFQALTKNISLFAHSLYPTTCDKEFLRFTDWSLLSLLGISGVFTFVMRQPISDSNIFETLTIIPGFTTVMETIHRGIIPGKEQPVVTPPGVLPTPPVAPPGVLPTPPVAPPGVLPTPPVAPPGVLPTPPVAPPGVLPVAPVPAAPGVLPTAEATLASTGGKLFEPNANRTQIKNELVNAVRQQGNILSTTEKNETIEYIEQVAGMNNMESARSTFMGFLNNLDKELTARGKNPLIKEMGMNRLEMNASLKEMADRNTEMLQLTGGIPKMFLWD